MKLCLLCFDSNGVSYERVLTHSSWLYPRFTCLAFALFWLFLIKSLHDIIWDGALFKRTLIVQISHMLYTFAYSFGCFPSFLVVLCSSLFHISFVLHLKYVYWQKIKKKKKWIRNNVCVSFSSMRTYVEIDARGSHGNVWFTQEATPRASHRHFRYNQDKWP